MRKRDSLSSENGLSRQDRGRSAPELSRQPITRTRALSSGWFASPHSHLPDSGTVCRHIITRPRIGDKGGLWRGVDATAGVDLSTEPTRGTHSLLTVISALRPEQTGCGADWAWRKQSGSKKRSCAMASAQVARSSKCWPWRGHATTLPNSSSTSGSAGRWAITSCDGGVDEVIGSFAPRMRYFRPFGATAIPVRSWFPVPGIQHWRGSAGSQRKTAVADLWTTTILRRQRAARFAHGPLAEEPVSGPRHDRVCDWSRAS
jgi:hypothetical protein